MNTYEMINTTNSIARRRRGAIFSIPPMVDVLSSPSNDDVTRDVWCLAPTPTNNVATSKSKSQDDEKEQADQEEEIQLLREQLKDLTECASDLSMQVDDALRRQAERHRQRNKGQEERRRLSRCHDNGKEDQEEEVVEKESKPRRLSRNLILEFSERCLKEDDEDDEDDAAQGGNNFNDTTTSRQGWSLSFRNRKENDEADQYRRQMLFRSFSSRSAADLTKKTPNCRASLAAQRNTAASTSYTKVTNAVITRVGDWWHKGDQAHNTTHKPAATAQTRKYHLLSKIQSIQKLRADEVQTLTKVIAAHQSDIRSLEQTAADQSDQVSMLREEVDAIQLLLDHPTEQEQPQQAQQLQQPPERKLSQHDLVKFKIDRLTGDKRMIDPEVTRLERRLSDQKEHEDALVRELQCARAGLTELHRQQELHRQRQDEVRPDEAFLMPSQPLKSSSRPLTPCALMEDMNDSSTSLLSNQSQKSFLPSMEGCLDDGDDDGIVI